MKIQFGTHSFDTVIHDIKLARLADMKNEPDKRTDENGKPYTPASAMLLCWNDVDQNYDRLFFVLEDIENTMLTTGGACVIIGNIKVRITRL